MAVLIGIALVIIAVVTWLGHLSAVHAVAVLIGALGVLLVLYGVVPAPLWTRRPGA